MRWRGVKCRGKPRQLENDTATDNVDHKKIQQEQARAPTLSHHQYHKPLLLSTPTSIQGLYPSTHSFSNDSTKNLTRTTSHTRTRTMACLICFSKEPLSQSEMNGKYGGAFGQFSGNRDTFDISLCETPCKTPCCWLVSMACLCPLQVHLRHRVLNHVEPGSGWRNYMCCQGMFGGCCCLQPGQMCEKTCPVPCMCLEAFCCPGLAVSASGSVIRARYNLGLDEDDVRLIRCSNCLQIFSCVCSIIACLTPCEADDQLARIIDIIADVVFCCVSGCMTAQVYHEVGLREKTGGAPSGHRMHR